MPTNRTEPPAKTTNKIERPVMHLDGPPKDTSTMTVQEAWTAVMRAVQGLGKHQKMTQGGTYNYRGIDDLMNAVGPALREYGVTVLPYVRQINYRDVQTSQGKASREVTVVVDYQIIGPDGDTMQGASAGESMDFGDKGTAKAMSVAYRVFLLQALTLPTDEPDPDSQAYERSNGPVPQEQAQETADRIPSATEVGVLQGVKQWAADRGLLTLKVTNQAGDSVFLGTMFDQRIDELDPAAGADKQANIDKALGGGE
jgi:hypothetical protein